MTSSVQTVVYGTSNILDAFLQQVQVLKTSRTGWDFFLFVFRKLMMKTEWLPSIISVSLSSLELNFAMYSILLLLVANMGIQAWKFQIVA